MAPHESICCCHKVRAKEVLTLFLLIIVRSQKPFFSVVFFKLELNITPKLAKIGKI